MTEHVGVVRDQAGLDSVCEALDTLHTEVGGAGSGTRNLWTVARLVAAAARARRESRGSHYRRDCGKSAEPYHLVWCRRQDPGWDEFQILPSPAACREVSR